jgi:hypothetical protein
MSELDKEYESSLKSIETENKVDRAFYRPIGFRIARALRGTGITPNEITIISIFVGAAAGYCFYFDNIYWNLLGILMLVLANILDCVDGQLARLTGIKSAIGRILDGMAGDVWFTCIYVGFALRLGDLYGITGWFFVPAVASGLSHLVQANITDYYKTLHLYFISKEKGAEFQSPEEIEAKSEKMPKGIGKFFYRLYHGYSELQVSLTPKLQAMLKDMHSKYGDDIPEDIRISFRKKSKELMKTLDLLTFNGRTIVMFIIVLTGMVWLYFVYEIVVLNTVLCICIKRHEKMCAGYLS